jgi:hypothetical protein
MWLIYCGVLWTLYELKVHMILLKLVYLNASW